MHILEEDDCSTNIPRLVIVARLRVEWETMNNVDKEYSEDLHVVLYGCAGAVSSSPLLMTKSETLSFYCEP